MEPSAPILGRRLAQVPLEVTAEIGWRGEVEHLGNVHETEVAVSQLAGNNAVIWDNITEVAIQPYRQLITYTNCQGALRGSGRIQSTPES